MKKNKMLTMIVCFLFGAAGGLLVGKGLRNGNVDSLITLAVSAAVFMAALVLSVIIHEGGHLVMGLLTGYKFSSFRIFSWILMKEDGRFTIKRFSIPGTGGQCKLAPPENTEPEETPFLLYHAGGFIFNFITAAICILICVVVREKVVRVPLSELGFVNIYLGIVNAVPMTIGIDNDGKNIVSMMKSPAERRKIYNLLKADALQAEGMSLNEMPESLFETTEHCETSFDSMSYSFNAVRLIEQNNYSAAAEKLKDAIHKPKIADVLKNEMKCEYIFCRMAEGAEKEEIDELYDKSMKNYVDKTQKFYISRRRFLYLYKLLIEKDNAEAEKEYDKFQKMEKKYPFSGEYKGERKIFDDLRQRFA